MGMCEVYDSKSDGNWQGTDKDGGVNELLFNLAQSSWVTLICRLISIQHFTSFRVPAEAENNQNADVHRKGYFSLETCNQWN